MNLKSKKGFTLVELTVVIAISAIIVTMCCGFIAIFTKYSYQLGDNQSAIIDITNVQSCVKEWIQQFDNKNYDIYCDGVKLIAQPAQNSVSGLKTNTLYYESGQLVWYENANRVKVCAKFTDVENLAFRNDVQNGVSNKSIVRCCVTYCGGKTQDLLFTAFTQTSRNRYSSSDR